MDAKDRGKEDFTKRLRRYCMSEADVPREDLVVPCRSVVGLSVSPKHPSAYRPKVLQTSDLDELKSWIGVDDRVARGRCLVEHAHRGEMRELVRLHKEVTPEKAPREQRALASRVRATANAGTKLEAIRAHARGYLFGDSTLVREAKPVIEGFFQAFEILVWLFPKIKVSSGSVLLFGPGSNVLLASELEIEEGGQVVSYGSLTANVGTLRKTVLQIKFAPYDLHLLAQGIWRR